MSEDQQADRQPEISEADREFMKLADAFIALANEHAENQAPANVGVAMLYAATRYNAFVIASRSDSAEAFAADRPNGEAFYNDQHTKMLAENLDENKKFFDGSMKYAHLMK